ncbi:class I SAM-dependent methyltransferase, partial [Candidatus Nomurabacteria bacterium]|nr:class I SAM-dependent methyltransferase [Candidatus Nomurabacteria bacterium]
MISRVAKYNLERDKNVLGKQWLSTYGNYFSSEENILNFIQAVAPFVGTKKLDILYVASASGLLGEKVVQHFGGNLTIIDVSQKHLDENKNPKTTKICEDLLNMNLNKKFDLIIMRSSLDYFPSKSLQIKVLKIIRRHLRDGGMFVNQPAYIPDLKERDIFCKIYNSSSKIGKRYFQSDDIVHLYKSAGFAFFRKISNGKELNITEKDHVERYEIDI